jgi:membrane protein implicated in regulation of membrane protease activity
LDLVVFLIVVLLLAAVVAVVSAPLRARRGGPGEDPGREADVAALEAAKEAKYREIRDAELDYRTGKLSEEDWRALDEQLRGEAVEILQRLDRAR